MPVDLQKHVRYPLDLFLMQGMMYAKYHMTDPTVFYNQEDLWIRATEKYYNNVQPVAPYYIMWQRPGEENLSALDRQRCELQPLGNLYAELQRRYPKHEWR